MYRKYRDRAEFLLVYIQEAHPADEWPMADNTAAGIDVNQPRTHDDRVALARRCCDELNLTMPCAIDTPDNAVDNAYAGWPERIFVIDPGGRIVYGGAQGPWGFKPAELEAWLRENTRPSVEK